MRVFSGIVLVGFACAVIVQLSVCEEVDVSEEAGSSQEAKSEEQDPRKDGKAGLISGSGRRTTTQSSANATRDSQLLSVLAARRRLLLHGRLATHINTLASLAHKSNRTNTTFAQLEVRDSNSSVVKRITFENNSNDFSPTLKLVTTDGSTEIRQDVKPHELRHLFIPKVYHDNRSRAGFLNNRRKEAANASKANSTSHKTASENNGAVYIPPEKLEGLDKEIELDPEEEFQVDESNHGLYLLNYSDADNVTINQELNKTVNSNDTKDTTTIKIETSSLNTTPKESATPEVTSSKDEKLSINSVTNNTENKNTKLLKVENEKDKTSNTTLFMSDEIYNHFRPLETELNAEDMAPFIYFGQKLGGQVINDNLTNLPSLSASTKAVNFIIAPSDKRKFNSRYSATEKYQNSSVDEEEINEDMDVAVVKNVIEKNKIRNSVKGSAPGRHVGLVNAYRKYTTVSTSKPPSIAQLNVTEKIISVTPSTIDRSKVNNRTSNASIKETINKTNISNSTDITIEFNTTNGTDTTSTNKINSTTNAAPRNYTRNYHNVRRRPSKITAASNSESLIPIIVVNATTEKASTLVYTAVVTSVSITSSMKGKNATDTNNGTIDEPTNLTDNNIPKAILLNVSESTPSIPTPTIQTTTKSNKHRIRIRTTTTESSLNSSPLVYMHKATESPILSEITTKSVTDLKNEATASRISERLQSLYGNKPEIDNSTDSSTIRPKNILNRRRRPTTVSTTTTQSTTTPFPSTSYSTTERPVATTSSKPSVTSSFTTTTEKADSTENTFQPFIVTSRTSSKSSSKPLLKPSNAVNSSLTNNTKLFQNSGADKEDESSREEVVIEAEKTYTASYVLAGIGFLPVAAIIAFVLRSILNKKTKELDTDYDGYFEDSDIKKENPIIPVARPPMPPPSKPDQKWEFPRNKLRLQTLLGQGNFGQVWKAEADDLTGHDGLTRLVAVKSIKETASQKEKQELLHEIYVMQKIGTHPNVVTLLACCTEQEPYLLIMEYVMCGKLLTYLRERRSRPDRFSGSGALTSRDLTVFAYCVARGMDYIASKGIVHRDLAARNVLVDHNKLCKIADFGMSREVSGNEERAKQRHALPVRWMAPEALLYNVYNHETDVWAYGILLWEIVTLGSTPYAAMTGREVLAAVTEGYRLERPPHCKPQLYRAMHSCWHSDPTQRPSFATIKSQLAELLDNEPAEGNYVDLDSFYQESSVYSDPSAIIHDEEGLSAEYDRERRVFRELATTPTKYDNRAFSFRDEDLRKFGVGTPRMGGFGIRDVPFNGDFNERFNDPNFTERKDGKLSTSSFHRERERDNTLVSRNSFSGFPRINSRDPHFQLISEGRNKRVPEFECDI
ncbi:dual specificity protein kinase splB isoform X2 [Plutella xylostella]|uniref:dual specificity protein kinase splB isoform X1 n=1 Tax=Plutella xylostella TaxID=51655 RepID=UPI0020322B95|nr:dual specificity protein kinase splB isoform X1 [Plutella xylostella]XP_048485010.1 dual specificity protein kinase splB isoform X2 [Plutella xylostella]